MEKARTNGIDIDLRQSAAERIEEARDHFKAGEHHFLGKNYREAADNYQKSIDIIQTFFELTIFPGRQVAQADKESSACPSLRRQQGER